MRCPFWQLHSWKLCGNASKSGTSKVSTFGKLPIFANSGKLEVSTLGNFVVANFGIPQCFQKRKLPASSSKFPNLAIFELPKTYLTPKHSSWNGFFSGPSLSTNYFSMA